MTDAARIIKQTACLASFCVAREWRRGKTRKSHDDPVHLRCRRVLLAVVEMQAPRAGGMHNSST